GFEGWAHLVEFADAIRRDGPVARFETAVEAVSSGDVAALRSMLHENPELVRARSTRRHHATLLPYVASNGVDGGPPKTPDNLAAMAGLGRVEDTARLLPVADNYSRHIALALAAQHGHADVVRLLLDAGEDPNRYNPDGFHSHSTPLHQAVCSGHAEVVKLL